MGVINMANYYEPMSSELLPDRWGSFKESLRMFAT